MQVREIWRYPVKSMGGETLTGADVTDLGIDGDRRWGIVDLADGNVLTARRAPDLLFASARVDDAAVVVTLPGGREIGMGDDADLSSWLGRDVSLRRAGDVGGWFENPLNAVDETDWVRWQGPPGAWHDSARTRVSIVSTTSMGSWDRRRFRANLIVDGANEDDLVRARLRVGDVEMTVRKRIDRCVMVTRPQPGLDRDVSVLTAINRHRDSCLAIGALVATSGRIELGDQVERIGELGPTTE